MSQTVRLFNTKSTVINAKVIEQAPGFQDSEINVKLTSPIPPADQGATITGSAARFCIPGMAVQWQGADDRTLTSLRWGRMVHSIS